MPPIGVNLPPVARIPGPRGCHPERQRRTSRPSGGRLWNGTGLRLGTSGPSEYLRVTGRGRGREYNRSPNRMQSNATAETLDARDSARHAARTPVKRILVLANNLQQASFRVRIEALVPLLRERGVDLD